MTKPFRYRNVYRDEKLHIKALNIFYNNPGDQRFYSIRNHLKCLRWLFLINLNNLLILQCEDRHGL